MQYSVFRLFYRGGAPGPHREHTQTPSLFGGTQFPVAQF